MRKFLTYALLLVVVFSSAQETRLLVRNGSNQSIQMKWFSQKLIYPEGIFIYRKTNNSAWEKITVNPVNKKQNISTTNLAQDEQLNVFSELIKEYEGQEMPGFVLLNVLIKSFQSNVFADYLGIYFEDQTIIEGDTQQYKITELINGQEKELAISEKIISEPNKAPLAPDSFIVWNGEKKANLKWKIDDERFYAVHFYRKMAGEDQFTRISKNPKLITPVPDDNGNQRYPDVYFVDDSLQEGKTYQYQITGLDYFGDETEKSMPQTITIEDLTPPLKPRYLRKKVIKGDVLLSWSPQFSRDLMGFYVYESSKSEGDYTRVNLQLISTTDSSFRIKSPSPGPHYYCVASVDSSGNETRSDKVFVNIDDQSPPQAPVDIEIIPDTGKMIITWKANTEKDLMGYQIFRSIQPENLSNFVLLTANAVLDTLYTDYLPTKAQNSFFYYVVAIDSAYNRSNPSSIVRATLPDINPPSRPFITHVENTENGIQVTWLTNLEADLKNYQLYRIDSSQKPTLLFETAQTSYTDTKATSNQTYLYYLIAVDSSENASRPSNTVEIMAEPTEKIASQTLKLNVKKLKKKERLVFSWNEVPQTAFVGYVLLGGTDKKYLKPLTGTFQQVKQQEPMPTSTYYYQVRGYYQNGTIIESNITSININ